MRHRKRNPALTKEFFQAWRHHMSWTQQQCADALGITQAAWNHWEKGRAQPPPYLGYALAYLESKQTETTA